MTRERRIRYPIAWLFFLAAILVGAGLASSPDPSRRAWGLILLLAPLILLLLLLAAYYIQSRRGQVEPPQPPEPPGL